jgi:hypothetical protein
LSRRAATWLAWGLWALIPLLLCADLAIRVVWGTNESNGIGATLTFGLAFIAFGTVGALVASRVPGNALGWIFIAIGVVSAAIGPVGGYATHGLVDDPGSLPGALGVGWLYSWLWFLIIGLIFLVPLLFPDGQVPGPRWRWVARILIGLVALGILGIAVYPGRIGDGDRGWPANPLGIDALKGVLDTLAPFTAIALIALALASAASVVVRFRRSRGDERQQLKWMVYAVAVLVCALVVPAVAGSNLGDVVFGLAVLLVPVAIGVAMLKYRLYDVDRVISKTLVYGALTAVLAATYVGLVLAAQALFSSFAGGSNLAIAVSTLVVAALFLPVRSRVQRFVDRRFYRRRYDAQRTLESFGARLRDEVDLDALSGDLRVAVDETMQPAHVGLWLRMEAGR